MMAQKTIEDLLTKSKLLNAVGSFSFQTKIVLYVLICLGVSKDVEQKILTSDILKMYNQFCRAAGLKILTPRRVGGILTELCQQKIITTRVVSLGRHGWMREIFLILSEDLIYETKVLLEREIQQRGIQIAQETGIAA